MDASASASLSALELVADEVGARRDLNKDDSVGLAVPSVDDGIDGLTIANVLGQNFYLVGDLNNGSTTKPLGDTKMLLIAENTAWKPEDGETVTHLYSGVGLSSAPDANADAVYAVTADSADGSTTTTYSFDENRVLMS